MRQILRNLLIALILVASVFTCKLMAWENKIAEANWAVADGVWDTDHWDSEHNVLGDWVTLTASGIWAIGYRPANIRITFTGVDETYIGVADVFDAVMFEGTVSSGQSNSLSFAATDIKSLTVFHANSSFSITKIEFGYDHTLNIAPGNTGSVVSGGAGKIAW